jgi:hypothetical protein
MTVQYPTVWRIIAYLYSLIINIIKYSLIKSYIQLEGSYMTHITCQITDVINPGPVAPSREIASSPFFFYYEIMQNTNTSNKEFSLFYGYFHGLPKDNDKVNFYQITRHYNPEDSHLRTNCCEKLKQFFYSTVQKNTQLLVLCSVGIEYLLFVLTFPPGIRSH